MCRPSECVVGAEMCDGEGDGTDEAAGRMLMPPAAPAVIEEGVAPDVVELGKLPCAPTSSRARFKLSIDETGK